MYNNNECAQLIDGLWFSHVKRQKKGGTSSSMRIGLATTGQNYYSIVPIIHAVTAACGALVMVFLGTGHSRGYSVSTDPVSDLLRATEGGPELLHALPQACL
eukprot:COSAG01_NODE_1114_length_11650_cov_28.837590_3_plen_102_part_00